MFRVSIEKGSGSCLGLEHIGLWWMLRVRIGRGYGSCLGLEHIGVVVVV